MSIKLNTNLNWLQLQVTDSRVRTVNSDLIKTKLIPIIETLIMNGVISINTNDSLVHYTNKGLFINEVAFELNTFSRHWRGKIKRSNIAYKDDDLLIRLTSSNGDVVKGYLLDVKLFTKKNINISKSTLLSLPDRYF